MAELDVYEQMNEKIMKNAGGMLSPIVSIRLFTKAAGDNPRKEIGNWDVLNKKGWLLPHEENEIMPGECTTAPAVEIIRKLWYYRADDWL